jgi:hypothetical protein
VTKRERQYQHIKEQAEERGTNPRRAKEIAARTVIENRAVFTAGRTRG